MLRVLFLFLALHVMICLPLGIEDLVVWEATPSELEKVLTGPKPKELNFPVNTWYETVRNVVEGKGGSIQREKKETERLIAYKDSLKGYIGHAMRSTLQWTERIPREKLPLFLTADDYGKPGLIQFRLNDFPWRLPKGVQHWVMWTRGPQISKEAFDTRLHETIPNAKFNEPARVEALMDYLNHEHFYGWTGLPDEAINEFEQASFVNHPWRSQNQQMITRQEGVEAMRWVSRHICELIAKEFPTTDFETVWNRNNFRVRSILDPGHIHILVKPKDSPGSYAASQKKFSFAQKLWAFFTYTEFWGITGGFPVNFYRSCELFFRISNPKIPLIFDIVKKTIYRGSRSDGKSSTTRTAQLILPDSTRI